MHSVIVSTSKEPQLDNISWLTYKSQYGFHTLHSTELAYFEIIDIIGKDLANGKLPIGVFLDLSKAFDTLDQSI